MTSNGHLAEVVTLYETNSRSIPEMLRKLADSIEGESTDEHDMTESVLCVQVKESGDIEIYGWGKADERFYSAGILQAAVQQITRQRT